MKILVIDDLKALEKYKEQWLKLSNSECNPLAIFAQPDFLISYIKEFNIKNWNTILMLDKNNNLVAVFPLKLLNFKLEREKPPLKIAVSLTSSIAPYLDYLVESKNKKYYWKTLFNILKNNYHFDSFLIGPLHSESLNYLHLTSHENYYSYVSSLSVHNNYKIKSKCGNYQEYIMDISKKEKKNISYYSRRLENCGKVNFERSQSSKNIQKGLDFIFFHMEKNFKEKIIYKKTSSLKNTFIKFSEKSSGPIIFNLTLNGKIISSTFVLEHFDRWMFLFCSFDDNYKKFSVGKILLNKVIEEAFINKKNFCFGTGDFDYKKVWSQECDSLHVLIYSLTDYAKEHWSPNINWKTIAPLVNAG